MFLKAFPGFPLQIGAGYLSCSGKLSVWVFQLDKCLYFCSAWWSRVAEAPLHPRYSQLRHSGHDQWHLVLMWQGQQLACGGPASVHAAWPRSTQHVRQWSILNLSKYTKKQNLDKISLPCFLKSSPKVSLHKFAVTWLAFESLEPSLRSFTESSWWRGSPRIVPVSSMYWAECDCRKQSIVLEVRGGQIIFRNIILAGKEEIKLIHIFYYYYY